ncbi:MAG TPA: hypothetical protein VM901_03925 [Bdellovibrionota bacterium]|jgi:hypothetical protein|nr:hypothetical protein [Bdellovibrionota bacterium]
MTQIRRLLCIALFALPLVLSQPAFAQAKGGSSGSASPYDTRNTVGIILLSGLVGGVLGLSTLSFYERPQDHVRNITLGAGIGVIASALFMTLAVAQTPPPVNAGDWNLSPTLAGSDAYAVAFDLKF